MTDGARVAGPIGDLILLAPFLVLPRTPALVLATVLSGLVVRCADVYQAESW